MTILDEIQTSIRQHAEGAGSSVVGIEVDTDGAPALSSADTEGQ